MSAVAPRPSMASLDRIFDEMPLGVMHVRVLYEQGRPVDLLHLRVNRAVEELTGVFGQAGRLASEMFPGTESRMDGIARVAMTGEPVRYERYEARIDRWFEISAFRAAEDEVVVVAQDVSARKREEQARIASEERFRAIFVHAAVGMVQVEPGSGQVVDANEAFCRMLGYTHDELLRERWQTLTVQEDTERDLPKVKMLAGGEAQSFVTSKRYRRKDGSVLWARVTVTRVVESSGAVRLVAVVEDVTAQRAAEELTRLQASALEVAADGMLITSPMGTVQWVNAEVERSSGYTRQELVGMHASRLAAAVPGNDIGPSVVESLTAKRVWRGRVMAARKDGTSYPEELSITPVVDAAGEITHAIAIKQDVTLRERAERELAEVHERHTLALDAAEMGTLRLDYLTNEVVFDERARSVFAFDSSVVQLEQLVGRVHPDDLPIAHGAMDDLTRPDGPGRSSVQLRIVLSSGEVRWVVVHSIAKFVTEGGVRRAVTGFATMRDITRVKRGEEDLRSALKMEAVGRLAGGIAHDFNNLLGVIIGYTDSVLEQVDGNEALRRELEEVAVASRRAALLTGQLLAFSRKQMLVETRVEVYPLVVSLATMLRRMLGERIGLVVPPVASPLHVVVDRGQLQQVVMNLVVNARDAMPHGGTIVVEIKRVQLDEQRASTLGLRAGPHVLVEVRDDGLGMDEATRARIFEPFFTTKEVGKGTGLGLSTVYGIVKQSNGAIDVTSARGRGTRFFVYLPSDERATTAAASVESPSRAAAPARAKGTESILLVEDEIALRGVLERILRGAGYRVACAANAEQAERLLDDAGAEIDLLITDVVMPGAGGNLLAERARAKSPGIRVLFMSGYTDTAELGDVDKLHLLRKPFDRTALTAKVRSILDGA